MKTNSFSQPCFGKQQVTNGLSSLQQRQSATKRFFLLLPNANDIANVDKKISTRIELQSIAAMNDPPKVTLVTDGTCSELNNYYCHSSVFKAIINKFQAHKDKIFCASEIKKNDVKNLLSLHA